MATYEVSREIETVATGKASTTSTAKSSAAASVRETIEAAGDLTVETEAVDVFEFPAGPFDPYRITVRATVAVVVDADDESAALEDGRERVDAALAAADLDDWEYAGSAAVEAPT